MRRLGTLLLAEGKRLQSDRMQLLMMAAPVLLIIVTVYGLPIANRYLEMHVPFDFHTYYPQIFGMFICLIPLMLGVVAGFGLLDERDEQLIVYYSVTPISRNGYMIVRYLIPVAGTAIYIVLLFALQQQVMIGTIPFLFIFIMLMMEMVIMGLSMSVFAMNKVEGLALSKAAGVIVIIPQLVAFFPEHLQWLGWWAPPYWIVEMLTLSSNQSGTENSSFMVGVIGLIVHSFVLIWLYRKYRHQVE